MATNDALFLGLLMITFVLLWVSWIAWSARESAIAPTQAERQQSAGDGEAPRLLHEPSSELDRSKKQQSHRTTV